MKNRLRLTGTMPPEVEPVVGVTYISLMTEDGTWFALTDSAENRELLRVVWTETPILWPRFMTFATMYHGQMNIRPTFIAAWGYNTPETRAGLRAFAKMDEDEVTGEAP